MKNRPLSAHSHHSYSRKPSTFSSIKTLVASGLGLIGIGSLLLLTFFVSTNSIKQNQDLGSQASIPQGLVTISQSQVPTTPALNQENAVVLKMNAGSAKLEEVSLLFDVITDVTYANDFTVQGLSSNLDYKVEKDDVDHGFKVQVTVTPKNASAGIVTNNQAMDFIKINYLPHKSGTLTLSYDREKSRAIIFGSNPKQDQLTNLPTYIVTIGSTAAPQYPEDFYLVADNPKDYYKFYEISGSRNEVNGKDLVVGQTYTVRHTARIQNINDDPIASAPDPVIVNTFTANEKDSVSRTFKRSDLTQSSQPLQLQFETTFKAQSINSFRVVVDSTSLFPEVNETNNDAGVTYAKNPPFKACNEVCSYNSDCADNYTCTAVGSEKRCRLSTNLTSTSCTADSTKHNVACNQGCANNNECANGMTCYLNQCRNPYNIESTSCINPDSRMQQLITENCNQSCTDNRGCANNMRCFNGSCRLATNPSSTSCSAATSAAVSSNYSSNSSSSTKGGTTKGGLTNGTAATPRPIATATPKPTTAPVATSSALATPTPTPLPTNTPEPTVAPTPEPTPVSQPNETLMDTLMSRLSALKNPASWSGSLFTGALLPLIIIGAGVVLLIVAIIIVLKPSRPARIATPDYAMPPTPTPPKTELHAKPNPPPPPIPGHGVIVPKKTTFADAGGTTEAVEPIKKPDIIEMPSETKTETPKPELPKPASYSPTQFNAAPTQTVVATPATTDKPAQSMMERLKQKGIAIPEGKTSQVTPPSSSASSTPPATAVESGESPSGDSQPPAAGWPEESQK